MARHLRVSWKTVAQHLAAALPRERLHPAVCAWTEQSAWRGSWAVAFSGGADSLATLLLAWAHWPKRRARLAALHFNHRLRGRESDGDEKFCAGVCAALGVKFVAGAWQAGRPRRERPAARRSAPPTVSEAGARAARLAFFKKHARVLWLGHQQDDVAETMLMRLARGSGAGGLAAPRPVQAMPGGRVHLRPLLSLKIRELVAALRAAGAMWREDATNARDDFFRNRIRRAVLPAWTQAAQRDALGGAARARELLEEDDAALEAWVDAVRPLRAGGALDLKKLAGKPRAVVRRALHRWLRGEPRTGELSRQAFDALLAAVERGAPARHSVGREGFAVIRGGALRFERIGKRSVKLHGRAN